MKITKFGHSCVLVEENGVRFLFDPGVFSNTQNSVSNLTAIFITHSHPDHLNTDSLKAVLQNNAEATIYTNNGCAEILANESLAFTIAEDGWVGDISGVEVKAIGKDHCQVHEHIAVIPNTGYVIANKFFHPGDCLTVPGFPIEILAFPLTAPWSKVSETIDFLSTVKPKNCFPVHDAILSQEGQVVYQNITKSFTEKVGTKYYVLELQKEYDF